MITSSPSICLIPFCCVWLLMCQTFPKFLVISGIDHIKIFMIFLIFQSQVMANLFDSLGRFIIIDSSLSELLLLLLLLFFFWGGEGGGLAGWGCQTDMNVSNYFIQENARFTAFTISLLLSENQQVGQRGEREVENNLCLLPPFPPFPHHHHPG